MTLKRENRDPSQHESGETKCIVCDEYYLENDYHVCYVRALSPSVEPEKIIFYDFECTQENGKHVPIFCGTKYMHSLWKKNSITEKSVSVYRKPTHTDRYLDFNSSHPILAKRTVVRALMERAENVCSDPVILAKEVEHLGKVLCYNNYPQWLIDKWGKSDKNGPLIHPDTGYETKKQFYISVPYFPGLSESYKGSFKYTAIQVCFKGVNILKSMLMHPKDKISMDQRRMLFTTRNVKQTGVPPFMLERHPGPSVRGSRNTPS